MDDRNGECFDQHEDLYGAINTSDSEHECLKDFLLEPDNSSRNVPCSNDTDDILSSLSNCLESKMPPQISLNSDNIFDDYVMPVSNKLSSNSDNSSCCLDTIENSPPLQCNTNLDFSGVGPAECVENNGSYFSPVADSVPIGSSSPVEAVNDSDGQKVCGSSPEESSTIQSCDSDQLSAADISPETPSLDNGDIAKGSRGKKRRVTERMRTAGPAKKKRQPITTYRSLISPDQNGIKLKIKMSSPAQKPNKRSRKRRPRKNSGSEDDRPGVAGREMDEVYGEQSPWGDRIPINVLEYIFQLATQECGCVPFLLSASRVCHLWRSVALSPFLWHSVDLSRFKERYKNGETFRWLCEHRLTQVQELNVAGWKVQRIQSALEVLCDQCPQLRGIGLGGWEGLGAEHVRYLLEHCPQLARIDLSSINPECYSRGAVSLASLSHMAQTMGPRLTHLVLADNKMTALPQVLTALAQHCLNLQVLDLSNLRTYTTALLHVERLQEGCPALRVLRITNSTVALSSASLKEQVSSPGFPALEELSVAGVTSSTPVMDDNSIERLLKTSHKLRLLDVRGCGRVSDSSLVRVPAWDLEHLFLSGCYVTRLSGSGLELIAQKWSHSLVEVDLGWSSATQALDLAVCALAERGPSSPLRVLNLCGSSVSLDPVKQVLASCPALGSLNLSSCRALPRGMKRLYEGVELAELRSSLQNAAPEEPDDETN